MYTYKLFISLLTTAFTVSELSAHGPIMEALTLGNSNTTREHCIWRRGGDLDPCPDPDIFFYLYTPRGQEMRPRVESLVLGSRAWLHASGYDPTLDSVVLVHGYAGVTDSLPIGVLRDAYIRNGSYNVFVVDWGGLARIPCYGAAVHNMKPVARCLSQMLTFLRDSGVPVHRTTCVGHSLGAHICGITSNYLLFRMHKIIGLDPARPLIRNQVKGRLDLSDADIVQIIHTSSTFGDNRQLGHVDFCINGGRIQPFCYNTTNEALCSHIRSVCYMAETLTPYTIRQGIPCSRRCSLGERTRPFFDRLAPAVALGHNTPNSASGTYCVFNTDAPYCPTPRHPIGNVLCCVPPKTLINEIR
ncbi:phospholipase A1-like isoform X2 [Lycorma delicatula]|uniref:phospholipase A1-like isoform X2 n=1 Tax=Lycorma delicatula TaxID=130591 RepID=UPI003F513536